MADTTHVVSERELEVAFLGTNFGGADHRKLIEIGVFKKACGFHCGHTLTQIVTELKLISAMALSSSGAANCCAPRTTNSCSMVDEMTENNAAQAAEPEIDAIMEQAQVFASA